MFTTANVLSLLGGAALSLGIALGAMIIGLMMGTILAAMRISNNKILKTIASIYIEIVRGTPMLLQILFIFIGLPTILLTQFGIRVIFEPIPVGIVAIGLNSAAYMAELIRSGIQSIDKGQIEAAKTLGLDYKQYMKFIILPQVFRRLIPPLTSEFIMLIKDSSLIYAIGGLELLGRAKVIGARTFEIVTPLLGAAILYLVMTYSISILTAKLERRYQIID